MPIHLSSWTENYNPIGEQLKLIENMNRSTNKDIMKSSSIGEEKSVARMLALNRVD